MYAHAVRFESNTVEKEKEYKTWLAETGLMEPFVPFLETSRTPWHVLEQRYYALNKDRINAKLNSWKKASDDISVLEHQLRCILAALVVEKEQRIALEDRVFARVQA